METIFWKNPFKRKSTKAERKKIRAAKKSTEYPKWKHLVPDNPTFEEFDDAWMWKFHYPFKECQILDMGGIVWKDSCIL